MKRYMKNIIKLRNNHDGVTLISLVITIVIMIILTFTLTINVDQYGEQRRKTDFQSDMSKLEQGISQYFAREKELPIINRYSNISMLTEIKNINDNNEYYVIDLDLLEVNLNYGKDYNTIKERNISSVVADLTDVYIINEQSHTIYYPKGITFGETIHYSSNKVYSNITVEPLPYDNPYIPTGFTHTQGTWNSGYVITETSTGNEFVWVPCVMNQNQVKAGHTVVTFQKTLPETTANTDPLYLYNKNNYILLPANRNVLQEDSSVLEIRTSVGTYGGFYIARYEAGIEGTTENFSIATKTVTDGTVKPLSKSGKGVWNAISRIDSIVVSKAMVNQESTGVKSTLISGECWDTTLQWMVNASDNKTANAGYDINPTGKGWYSNVSSGTRHLTGYYSVNNIYDMAGNVYDLTTENCIDNNGNVIGRGGYNGGTASGGPTANRNCYNETDEYSSIGFRPILYK